MPFIARKLSARRPMSSPLGSNIGVLATFAVAVLLLLLVAGALLQQTAEGTGTASSAAAMMLGSN